MSDPIIINKELPLNIMDFVIMQEISEMKLNRGLDETNTGQITQVKFYNDYISNGRSFFKLNGEKNTELIDEFKTAVGAQTNLDQTIKLDKNNQVKYDGGAGKYTKISSSQVDEFIEKYKILDYYGDDISGFSATVFQNISTGEKTISFRSTEFNEDYFKDTAADNEIDDNGTTWGQSLSMVKYIEKLKTTGVIENKDILNVTGYSLGGALGSTFYKMYSNEFNIKNLYVFNGPGAGELTSPNNQIDPYVSLKNDLNAYNALQTSLIQFYFQKAQAQKTNQLTASDYKTYLINTTPTLWTESQKNSLIDYADYLSKYIDNKQDALSPMYMPYENPSQFMNFIISSINPTSSIGVTQENEQNKDIMVAMNSASGTNGLSTTLYGSNFYQTYKNYLINRYDAQKAGDTKKQSINDALNGKKTGQLVDPSFYDNKAIWISGTSSFNYFNIAPNDYNFVSNSNKYTNPLDIIIEDRLELEKNGTTLPIRGVVEYLTKNLTGDFGNTHSITLLNKSLSLMTFLAKIEGKNTIDVKNYTGLISSASPEKADAWLTQIDLNNTSPIKDLNVGDGNSIAIIINSLYKMIVPNQEKSNDIIFDNTIDGWADINKIDQLEKRKNDIINQLSSLGITVSLHSFYQAKNEDFNFLSSSTNIFDYDSKDEILIKIKQNDNEGMAYRYALENLNSFVVLGLDYSSMNFKSKNANSQSEQWYSTRIDILLEMIKQNVGNYGDFTSQKTSAIIDDKNQYIRFHTEDELNKANLFLAMQPLENEANTPVGVTRTITNDYNTFYQQWSSKFHIDGIASNIVEYYDNDFSKFFTKVFSKKEKPKNTFSFSDNIYYLNPLSSSFYSRNNNANEKIFIAPDKLSVFNHLDGTNPFVTNTHGSYTNINDFDIVVNVDLKGGNDYVEVKSDYAVITGKKGVKTYYIDAKETKIFDYEKKGTITLDGILLRGGKKTGINEYTQTEVIDGVTNTIIYSLDYATKALMITHQNTGHKIYIESMANAGNGVAFNFDMQERATFDANGLLTLDAFVATPPAPDEKNLVLNSSYLSYEAFLADVRVNVSITSGNAVVYKEGTSLMLYDRENPSNMMVIRNFYNADGTIKQYASTVETVSTGSSGQSEIHYVPVSAPISLAGGLGADDSLHIYDINQQLITNNNRVIDHRSIDQYLIPTTVKGIGLHRDGYDLIFTNNGGLDSNDAKITIKNYFYFDHSVFTDIFTYVNGVKKEISYQELSKYIVIKLSDNGVYYQTSPTNQSNTITGGAGDDTIVGSAANEVFQSLGTYVKNLQNDQYTYNAYVSDGNDILTGGGGEDIFIFSGNFGSDTITDFRSDDRIILGYNANQHSMRRDGDDLILYSANFYNSNDTYGINTGMVSEVRVKNYFIYIDYTHDSRISYLEVLSSSGQSHYQLVDEMYPTTIDSPTPYVLSPEEIGKLQTKQMDDKTFNQGETVTDYSNPNNPVARSHNYLNIIGNKDDNTIIITRNNTVVKGNNDNGSEYDGDDTYIININEEVPTVKNSYRTEIDFGLNGGNDIIKNGSYKTANSYGDIVKINNTLLSTLVFNKEEENGILKSLTIILQDGSSIKLETSSDIEDNAQVLKLDDQVLTVAQIKALTSANVINGDSSDNYYDFTGSYKSQEIHGNAGNDTIIGGNADDILEGGKGYDDFYFSGGHDTYIFGVGDNVDVFHFKDIREKLNATFLIDNNFNTADIKYSYDENNHRIYLSFSQYEGVVFPDSEWLDFVFLRDGITIKKMNGEVITPPDNVTSVTAMPFITPANLINGTSSNDIITTDNSVSNVVYGKEGNDTIISQGSQNSYSLLFGGEGNDNIIANRRDIVAVKNGDGTDTISSTTKNYMIDILRSTTRVVNGQETLFDISSNGNDLALKYGDSTSNDKVVIKDYFLNNETGDISLGIYEESLNETKIYYLNNILQDLGITQTSLQVQGEMTINKSDVILRGAAQYGKVLGGEIAYEYLHGNYQSSDQIAVTLNKMNTTYNTVLDKHNT